jgi:Na+/H+ antiporter NhaC
MTLKKIIKTKSLLKTAIAVFIFILICSLAALYHSQQQVSTESAPWYSIVPPLIAILLAFLTNRVMPSLTLAVLTAGFLSQAQFLLRTPTAWAKSLVAAGSYVTTTLTDTTNLQILAFIPIVFAMIELMIASGSFLAIINWLLKYVKHQKSAQTITAFMGIVHFIDDYSNAIIVGSAMRPITDRFKVSREKLAFLVDATSAPVAGLAIVSTWISYEVGLFNSTGDKLGINKDGYAMFFDALQFRFYCLLMLIFVFLHIWFNKDFGPMKTAQKNALDNIPNDASNDSPPDNPAKESSSSYCPDAKQNALCAIIPLTGLLAFHITGLWFTGHNFERTNGSHSALSFTYWRQTIGNAHDTPLILAFAGTFGLTLAVICNRILAKMPLKTMFKPAITGVKKCLLPATILIMAWSLKNCCDALKTDEFLAALLAEKLSPLWFPALVFFVASITSFATGTSYGTMAILIPTAIPVAFQLDGQTYGLTTMICLGAVLDGAIFGDHCSPISDTTIISSISSSCNHLQHVRTQLPYSIFVALLALVCGYIPSALGLSSIWCINLAVLFMVGFFLLLTWYERRKRTHKSSL